MISMGVQATHAILAILFIATVKADEGGVTFWKENFQMTCPTKGIFFDKDGNNIGENEIMELKYDNQKKSLYHCEYSEENSVTSYYFYVQGKVCENCFELSADIFLMVIVMDMLLTTFVMMITYRCTKNKSSAGRTQTSKGKSVFIYHRKTHFTISQATSQKSLKDERPLNHHTLSEGTYSTVNTTG
uniref:Uncharacterized protein n=1 Tax=Mola mola TaxID=94237 RepID=A0A3Q3VUZ4_MOLML